MIKLVQVHENPTHKFYRYGVCIYVVDSSVIAVADAAIDNTLDAQMKWSIG